jgi:hypothetical protein
MINNNNHIAIFRIRACNTSGGEEDTYRILVAKPDGKRPLGRRKRKWVDNIKMDLREIG